MPELTAGPGVNLTEEDDDLIVDIGVRPGRTESGDAVTLQDSDAGSLLILTHAAPTLTVPDDLTWTTRTFCDVLGTAGAVTVVEGGDATVNPAAGQTLVTEDAGSAFTLVLVDADTDTFAAIGRFAAS